LRRGLFLRARQQAPQPIRNETPARGARRRAVKTELLGKHRHQGLKVLIARRVRLAAVFSRSLGVFGTPFHTQNGVVVFCLWSLA
jgi:hypothetical protein